MVRAAVFGLLVGSVVAAREARANGRFPAAQFVTVTDAPGGPHVALRATFGVVVSRDGGATWSWLCEELLGYATSGPPWDARIAWAPSPGGAPPALLVGLPDGLSRAATLCEAPRVADARRDFTGDLTTTADGAVYWVSSNGTGANRLMVSRDGGATFTSLGTLPEGVLPETLEVSGRRVYVTGVTVDPRRVVFFRSDDGGQRFGELPVDLRGGRDAFLSAIDPTSPDVVYVRSSRSDDGGVPGATLLLRSRDGGRTFEEVTRTAGPMQGFALSGDGRTIWVGGTDSADALRRSDDGGRSFQRVADVNPLCLRWHAGALWVCAPHLRAGWALGRSTDGGRSITPVLRFESLTGPARCDPTTPAASLCAPRWPAVRALVAPDAGVMDAAVARDAAVTPTPPPSDCACRARPAALGSTLTWLSCAALALRRRRRANAS